MLRDFDSSREMTYRKLGNFHVEIIHVVNIQCRFIFVGLWYPRKYFNIISELISKRMFSYNHRTCIVDIAHEY